MKRRYRNLITKVLMVIFLASIFTGCGDVNAADDAVPAPKVEAIPETSNVTETVEAENEAALEMEQSAETVVEPEVSEVSEPVLDESKYFVDGIFYPKEYARQLGYTLYESSGTEDFFSINHGGIEYYIMVTWDACTLSYECDGRCYGASINERLAPDFTPECRIATSGVIEENSTYFLNAEKTFIEEVAKGKSLDPVLWDISGVTFAFSVYECKALYREDGFIDAWSFENPDKSLHVLRNYK